MCLVKFHKYFRAGRNSPPAVKSASDCLWHEPIRRDSGTDSIVWMREVVENVCTHWNDFISVLFVFQMFLMCPVDDPQGTFCSEEGNQATAKRAFGSTRAYNEKIGEREARMLRKQHDF